MRKGAIIVLAVLMAAMFVSQVDAFALSAGFAAGQGAAAGWRSSVDVATGQSSIALDADGHHRGVDLAAQRSFAVVKAKGGEAAAARAVSAGFSVAA